MGRSAWLAARVLGVVGAMLATGCGCGCHFFARVPSDSYRALALGPPGERSAAATRVLTRRGHQARSVVRKAIAASASAPVCGELRRLAETLLDPCMDDPTRSSAALALGRIARDFPCTFPADAAGHCPPEHDPIPSWSQTALLACAEQKAPEDLPWWFHSHSCSRPRGGYDPVAPVAVARACAEALGYVPTTDLARLKALRDDVGKDTQLRIFAGRALSRLTRSREVTPDSLDRLVLDAESGEGEIP